MLPIDELNNSLSQDLSSSGWIDGLQHQVFLRIGAIGEAMEYLYSKNIQFDDGEDEMYSLLCTI